jgi:hypothetical protein
MSAWWNLLQKEFRMTRNSAFVSLAILLIGGLWLVYLSYRHNLGIIFVPSAFILFILLLYPFCTAISRTEGNLSPALSSPRTTCRQMRRIICR